ncbi:hypothetical protein D3C72_2262560 [compost metagenome]
MLSWCEKVRPSSATAAYATVVMPTPPAASSRWCLTSASVGRPCGVMPSLAPALIKRLRSVSGPMRTGVNAAAA